MELFSLQASYYNNRHFKAPWKDMLEIACSKKFMILLQLHIDYSYNILKAEPNSLFIQTANEIGQEK